MNGDLTMRLETEFLFLERPILLMKALLIIKIVVTRTIIKKNIDEKYLRPGDVIIENRVEVTSNQLVELFYF